MKGKGLLLRGIPRIPNHQPTPTMKSISWIRWKIKKKKQVCKKPQLCWVSSWKCRQRNPPSLDLQFASSPWCRLTCFAGPQLRLVLRNLTFFCEGVSWGHDISYIYLSIYLSYCISPQKKQRVPSFKTWYIYKYSSFQDINWIFFSTHLFMSTPFFTGTPPEDLAMWSKSCRKNIISNIISFGGNEGMLASRNTWPS